MTEGEVKTGTCVWFSKKKGIGFISKDYEEGDIFVHYSNLKMNGFKFLVPDQKVQFKIGANDVGEQAVEVMILEETES